MKGKFSKIKAVIGLGNPDAGYKNTYHNAGKLFVDFLRHGPFGAESKRFQKAPSGIFEICRLSGGLVLARPLNYMNENGAAINPALKASGAKIKDLLVVHDDSDLGLGGYKISFGSGSAGHRGAQSVIESIGTKNFWRLRIGIRPKGAREKEQGTRAGLPAVARRAKAGDFVLKRISAADRKILDAAFGKAAKEILGIT